MIKLEHNVETDEVIEIALTAEEIALKQKEQIELDKRIEQRQAEAEAKATEKAALLDRLGITAEEVKLLLS